MPHHEQREFNVGDVVVIRDWDDMEAEYGLDTTNDIPCRFTFTKDMKYLCGTEHVIRRINDNKRPFFEDDISDGWSISFDMLRHADDPCTDTVEIDEEQFLSVLCD